ncbi:MAG: hypothetical protein JSW40_02610 [Candidatus Omnitrophota bacterium]|nr:MAG: hypothetical protein JSW40_02610 [Candidatus Omnitrophota bacterium]
MIKILRAYRKSQISIYFISIMATLIAVTFIIINVGKVAKDKTHSANAADAGALAACSVMAQAFNYNSDDNGDDGPTEREAVSDQMEKDIDGQMDTANLESDNGFDNNTSIQGTSNPHFETVSHTKNIKNYDGQRGNQDAARRNEEEWHRDSQNNDTNSRKAMKDYYKNALYMGYMLNFQNSGTHHRLGKLSSKLYEQFLKSITPETVQNGVPYTFVWVDGAARIHLVTAIVEIEPVNNVVNRNQQSGIAEQEAVSADVESQYAGAEGSQTAGLGLNEGSKATWPCEPGASMERAATGESAGARAQGKSADAQRVGQFQEAGIKTEESQLSTNDLDNQNDIIKYRDDIVHSRMVYSVNFQFHMGSPIKGIGDIDEMTFYPPVMSSAIATFNYTGMGNIHRRGGKGSDPRHECGLIAAF